MYKRKNPDGFKNLLVYQRAEQLYEKIFSLTKRFPSHERRRREQMESCTRSVKQNIVEGWKRETTREYINFLSYSFGSLGELKEDVNDCRRDGLLSPEEHSELIRRCGEVDFLMRRLKEALEQKVSKQDYVTPFERWKQKRLEVDNRENEQFDDYLKKIVDEGKKGING